MQNPLQKILSRLEKQELSTRMKMKTELSAIGDLRNAISNYSDLDGVASEIASVEDLAREFRQQYNDLRSIASDFVNRYEDVQNSYSGIFGVVGDIEGAMDNYSVLADELGIDPSENATYREAQEVMSNLEEVSSAVDGLDQYYEDFNRALNLD